MNSKTPISLIFLNFSITSHNPDCVLSLYLSVCSKSPEIKNFNFSLRKFRYDIQAAWYSYQQDFPLQFIVVSHVTNEPPLIYTLSLKDLTVAYEGIPKNSITNEYIEDMRVPGIKQIINNYNWHLSNPDVDVDRGIFITNGRLTTNAYDTIYHSNTID